MREADDGADRHVGPRQQLGRARHVGRADADRRDVVLGRETAAIGDEVVVELRAQQVVDRLGQLAR